VGKYFGTDGIRGKAGESLTPQFALKAGYAIGKALLSVWSKSRGGSKARSSFLLSSQKRDFAVKPIALAPFPAIVIAEDTRLSSPMLADALKSGILASGTNVIDLGIVPTPALALAVNYIESIGGVMVTASHNPIEDNGIKVFRSNGIKAGDKLEAQIEKIIDEHSLTLRGPYFGKVVSVDFFPLYLRHLKKMLPGMSGNGTRVALDSAYGATSIFAKEVFSAFGFKPSSINDVCDGWRVNVNCGSTNTQPLRDFMREKRISLGFAFDGDGDRAVSVDEKFREVDGDKILAILALKHKPYLKSGKVVFTEMTNLGIESYLKERGIKCYRTGVGDYQVLAEMLRRKALIGGEQSGHIILWDKHCTGDGIFVSLFLALTLIRKSLSLSQVAEEIPTFAQVLRSIPVRDKLSWMKSQEFLARLNKLKRGFEPEVRFYIRPSGTENCVRILTESKVRSLAETANNQVSALFESLG